MSADRSHPSDRTPAEDEIERRRDRELLESIRKHFPEIIQEIKENARREMLTRMFARKLRRPLTEPESTALAARFESLPHGRVEVIMLDLDPAALTRWLADPHAT